VITKEQLEARAKAIKPLTDKEQLGIALLVTARQKRKVSRATPLNRRTPPSPKEVATEIANQADQSYDQLDGEWGDWLEVARRYEHKVPAQDRLDIRHDIIVELHRARQRDCKPLPQLRAYRIASLMVALYWRERVKREVKVCLYNGLPSEPHCKSCRHKPKSGICAYLALRPVESLDQPTTDYEGYQCQLRDTVADDKAIDLDAKLDDSIWLLGCPMRLIVIAKKIDSSENLTPAESRYLYKFRQKTQKRLF